MFFSPERRVRKQAERVKLITEVERAEEELEKTMQGHDEALGEWDHLDEIVEQKRRERDNDMKKEKNLKIESIQEQDEVTQIVGGREDKERYAVALTKHKEAMEKAKSESSDTTSSSESEVSEAVTQIHNSPKELEKYKGAFDAIRKSVRGEKQEPEQTNDEPQSDEEVSGVTTDEKPLLEVVTEENASEKSQGSASEKMPEDFLAQVRAGNEEALYIDKHPMRIGELRAVTSDALKAEGFSEEAIATAEAEYFTPLHEERAAIASDKSLGKKRKPAYQSVNKRYIEKLQEVLAENDKNKSESEVEPGQVVSEESFEHLVGNEQELGKMQKTVSLLSMDVDDLRPDVMDEHASKWKLYESHLERQHEHIELMRSAEVLDTGVLHQYQQSFADFKKQVEVLKGLYGPKMSSPEKNALIAEATTFDDLCAALKEIGSIESGAKIYTADDLISRITSVREDGADLQYITSTFGLREKVKSLLKLDSDDSPEEIQAQEILRSDITSVKKRIKEIDALYLEVSGAEKIKDVMSRDDYASKKDVIKQLLIDETAGKNLNEVNTAREQLRIFWETTEKTIQALEKGREFQNIDTDKVELKERTGTGAELQEVRTEWKDVKEKYESALAEAYTDPNFLKNVMKKGLGLALSMAGKEAGVGADLAAIDAEYTRVSREYAKKLHQAIEERKAKGLTEKTLGNEEGVGLRAAAANRFITEAAKKRQEIMEITVPKNESVSRALEVMRKHRVLRIVGTTTIVGVAGASTGLLAGLIAGGGYLARIAATTGAAVGVKKWTDRGIVAHESKIETTEQETADAFKFVDGEAPDIGSIRKDTEVQYARRRTLKNRQKAAIGATLGASLASGYASADEVSSDVETATDVTTDTKPEIPQKQPEDIISEKEPHVLSKDEVIDKYSGTVSDKTSSSEMLEEMAEKGADGMTSAASETAAAENLSDDATSELPESDSGENVDESATGALEKEAKAAEFAKMGTDDEDPFTADDSIPVTVESGGDYEVTVEQGDMLWKLLEDKLGEHEAFNKLSEAEQDIVLVKVFEHVDQNESLRGDIGMRSDDADMIFVGEKLNLEPLAEEVSKVIESGEYKEVHVDLKTDAEFETPTVPESPQVVTPELAPELVQELLLQNKTAFIESVEGEQRIGFFGKPVPTTFEKMEDMPLNEVSFPQYDSEIRKEYGVDQQDWNQWHEKVVEMKKELLPVQDETLQSYVDRYVTLHSDVPDQYIDAAAAVYGGGNEELSGSVSPTNN